MPRKFQGGEFSPEPVEETVEEARCEPGGPPWEHWTNVVAGRRRDTHVELGYD